MKLGHRYGQYTNNGEKVEERSQKAGILGRILIIGGNFNTQICGLEGKEGEDQRIARKTT